MRREFFKIYYLSNNFNLNEKADASEAFSSFLSLLHLAYTKQPILNETLDLHKHFDDKCNSNDCLAHSNFNMQLRTTKACRCGKKFQDETSNSNNFTHLVNMDAFISLCD